MRTIKKKLLGKAKVISVIAYSIMGYSTLALAQTVQASNTSIHFDEPKVFKVCPFNVDGLPQKIGFININPDGLGDEGAKAIGQYIAQSDIDILALSEDFNYHTTLANNIGKNYQVGTYRGGISADKYKVDISFDTDGLEFLCKSPFSFSNESWTKWNKCYGKFDHGNDELIHKGFRHYTVDLGDGALIDVYTMHMDADTSEKDNAARASQWEQLRDAILANNSHRPIIVMGDTNSRYTRDDILGCFTNPIEKADIYEVKDAWVELCKGKEYPTLGSDPLMVDQLGYLQGEVVDKVLFLNPKEGNLSIEATNFDVDETFDKGDHKPVIVTIKVSNRQISTGISNIQFESKAEIYDLNGMRRSQLAKGINIVRTNDGNTKKILVK